MGTTKKRIGIVGGGPSGLFVYKRLVEQGRSDFSVDIFEAKKCLGGGMPYSPEGACPEHITNVSGDEIPPLPTSIADWIETLDPDSLKTFPFDRNHFNDHKVLPRLLFGEYLRAQFDLLIEKAALAGLKTTVQLECNVSDIVDCPATGTVTIKVDGGDRWEFEHVVICTGHTWPRSHEGTVPGYFDSPYPPAKLARRFDHAVALRGSSLTAVDAIRTLARHNGEFIKDAEGRIRFDPHPDANEFRIVMHSKHGLLPCIRFHVETPRIGKETLIEPEELDRNMAAHGGFLSLDFLFEKRFKEPLREKDPEFYKRIEAMSIEEFVQTMLDLREKSDPFLLFKAEYAEAQKSIRSERSIYWKEMLSALSFAMNYPAKHMSAEDMLRHQRVLMPLISVVIAFVPQSSCDELMALHDAGRLELIAVGTESRVEPGPARGVRYHRRDEAGKAVDDGYQTFVDCMGQPHLRLEDFPFRSLVEGDAILPARVLFRDSERAKQMAAQGEANIARDEAGKYFLAVPGLAITDEFQAVGRDRAASKRIYVMAVPYIAGHNPDYSGLDFCEEASDRVVKSIFS